jgi:hypothetical protein
VDIVLGDQVLRDVQIPLLWGSRAISQDRNGHLTVIELSEGVEIEIIGDQPVPGVQTIADEYGFDIVQKGKPLYHYDPEQKTLSALNLDLPDCQVGSHFVRVGANTFENNAVASAGVGIVVTSTATWIGAQIPEKLRPLVA